MGFFDKAKGMYDVNKQAKQIKSELKNIHVEAEVDGMIVVVDGEQHFIDVTIPEDMLDNAVKIGKSFVEAANKAVKKSQQIAADKMKPVMSAMGGMFGGK